MEPTFSKALEDDFNDFETDYSIRQAEQATSRTVRKRRCLSPWNVSTSLLIP